MPRKARFFLSPTTTKNDCASSSMLGRLHSIGAGSPDEPCIPEIGPALRRVSRELVADPEQVVGRADLDGRYLAVEQRLQVLPDRDPLGLVRLGHEPVKRGVLVRAVPPPGIG